MCKSKGLLTGILLFSLRCYSQGDFRSSTWHHIDTSVLKKKNLSEVYNLVQRLKQKALAESNYYQTAHCYYYEMLIADQRTEDSLYFRNSSFIDSILLQPGVKKDLLVTMHLMQAKRLSGFTKKYLRFNRQRYEFKNLPLNYAGYSNQQLDSIAKYHFEQAKKMAKDIFPNDIDEVMWLSSDPLLFFFKPGLYDVIIAEQINHSVKGIVTPSNLKIKQQSWLSLTQDEFISKIDTASYLDQPDFAIMKFYTEWLNYNKTNLSAYYFIETLARKYFYGNLMYDNAHETTYEKLYEGYLKTISSSVFATVKAHAVYQLCLLWNLQSLKYFPANDGYDHYTGTFRINPYFDSTYQYYAKHALDTYYQNKNLLDSFSFIKNILKIMEKQILAHSLKIKMEENNLPGQPILAELIYKNIPMLYYRIVSVKQDYKSFKKKKDDIIKELLQEKNITQKTLTLPLPDDHNKHALYLRFDPLSSGKYFVLLSDSPIDKADSNISYVSFDVTSITVLNNDKRVYVLDRKTGFPLSGAKVEGWYIRKTPNDTTTVIKKYVVNKEGYVTIGDNKAELLTVIYGNDTTTSSFDDNDNRQSGSNDIFNKDEYDDLLEFYEENAQVHIFTDRSIYRPGQTVFYKALFTTNNAKTGEMIVMNRQNMKGILFKNGLRKWIKDEEPLLYIADPFGKEIDSVSVRPNEFGSQSGSFVIPKTAATGEWNIEPDYIDVDSRNNGEFQVEEYKRPSFDVSIETPKDLLKPGDPFSFIVKVRSFAGASLNNVRVNYTVMRSGNLPVYDSVLQRKEEKNEGHDLLDTTGYTDANGELKIFVNDSVLKKYSLDNNIKWDFDYSLNAEVIDATGESYEANEDLRISSRPVRINIPLEKIYERNALTSINVSTLDKYSKKIPEEVVVKLYKLPVEEKIYSDRKLQKADQWIYSIDELEKQFPYFRFREKEKMDTINILEKRINSGKSDGIDLPITGLPSGNYLVEAFSEENNKITGEAKRNFSIFDLKENKQPDSASFSYLPVNLVMPGDKVSFYNGNTEKDIYPVYHVVYNSGKNKKTGIGYFYSSQKQNKGITKWVFNIPADVKDELKLTQVYVLNNNVYVHEERIFINKVKSETPEIVIERYRKKLIPGAKESFSVSVKTKNEKIAAEILTTMYEASLDKLQEHHWEIPQNDNYHPVNASWQRSINSIVNNYTDHLFADEGYSYSFSNSKPLWWMNNLDYSNGDVMGYWNSFGSPGIDQMLQGRVSGLNIINTDGLNEVVVIGYGVSSKRNLTSSVSAIRIRGAASLNAYNQPLIIIDGVPFSGDLNKIDPKTITDIMILKGADATAIYGARATEGILLLSTKGEIVLPASEPDQVMPVRKNFSETAFFFPQVHADKDGYYIFIFTMPESVTEWNWKLLAHTKKAQFAYAERKLNTQLPLMIQPNMPRLLYQGDRIILQSRISNLDTIVANGKIVCKIEDAVTGEDITLLIMVNAQNNFSVGKKENISSEFEIKIPESQTNPIKIVITVRSQNFADGEEHIVPILSPKIFVRENIPFHFSNNTDTIIPPIHLSASDELYGIGLSILPKPQSALINALPYLANYSFDCAEQTFNKLLADVTAFKIMRTDTEGQKAFEQAKQMIEKQPEQKEQLPDELSEQAMPWLNLSNKTAIQQRQLFELLDTNKAGTKINEHLEKLYKLQNTDGGLTWFDGGRSNPYISNYVLAGFGKLQEEKLAIPERIFTNKYADFIRKLIAYCDNQPHTILVDPFYYIYARSFWKGAYSLDDSSFKSIQSLLNDKWKKADEHSLYGQAILITSTLRYFDRGDSSYQKAIKQLNSIEQLAIKDDINGIRWKDLADADDLSNTVEETLSLIAEAYSEAGVNQEMFPGIIKWLLTAKNEHQWSSTKATAAVIGMLTKENKTATGITQTINSKINNKDLIVTDNILNGNTFSFVKESKPFTVELKKQNSIPAVGNIMWYYFTSSDNLNKMNKEVNLKKDLFRYNNATEKWETINNNTSLKISDKIKVVLTIETSKALSYVYIDDKRAAAFEPKEIHSGYHYEQDFGYYLSVRDAGMQFFSDFIPSGKSAIFYEMVVAQEGNFMNGPASLQCMYRPEINAYSNSVKVQTIK